jgi:cytoskeletal protein CcmA (bactofilin family)
VDGSLTAFDAPVTIAGRVNGDVVAFNGRVELRSGAIVTGDVVSRDAPVVASGATIGGTPRSTTSARLHPATPTAITTAASTGCTTRLGTGADVPKQSGPT